MQDGFEALAWDPQEVFLWAAPTGLGSAASESAETVHHFIKFTFYKSVGTGVSSQVESGRLTLLGSDRVLLLAHPDESLGRRMAHGAPSKQWFSLQLLLIPYDYLGENWLPSRIAVNDDASVTMDLMFVSMKECKGTWRCRDMVFSLPQMVITTPRLRIQ